MCLKKKLGTVAEEIQAGPEPAEGFSSTHTIHMRLGTATTSINTAGVSPTIEKQYN